MYLSIFSGKNMNQLEEHLEHLRLQWKKHHSATAKIIIEKTVKIIERMDKEDKSDPDVEAIQKNMF